MKKYEKSPEVTFARLMMQLKQAGLPDKKKILIQNESGTITLENIDERIRNLLGIFRSFTKRNNNMIYFIMYDIEHNKIRNYIAKYLQRKGCTRVQKSIFLASTDRKKYDEIQNTLKSVQEMYENNDSVFFVPVSTDEIRAMKVIGKSVDFDLITGSRNTLFI